MGTGNAHLRDGVELRLEAEPAQPLADTSFFGAGYVPLARLTLLKPDSVPTRWQPRVAGWAPFTTGDSLYIVVGDGFTGVEARLTLRGHALRGSGSGFADVPSIRRHRSLTGHRIACPSVGEG